jgi:hypothetical protein
MLFDKTEGLGQLTFNSSIYFPGIDEQNIYGLCATRIIELGSANPVGAWKIKRMAQYPTSS